MSDTGTNDIDLKILHPPFTKNGKEYRTVWHNGEEKTIELLPYSNRQKWLVVAVTDTERYGYSQLTDTWYIVHDYEDLGDGRIVAKSKEPVEREDVPQHWIDGVNERKQGTEGDRDE